MNTDTLYIFWRMAWRRIAGLFGVKVGFSEREYGYWLYAITKAERICLAKSISEESCSIIEIINDPSDTISKELTAVVSWLEMSTEPHILLLASKTFCRCCRSLKS